MTAVTAVDKRNACIHRRSHCRTLYRVAHCDNVGTAAYNCHGIFKTFTFGNRRIERIVKTDCSAAEFEHCSLKRHLSSCARLIEKRSKNFAVAGVSVIGRIFHNFFRFFNQHIKLFFRHCVKVNKIFISH